ncbi:DUF4252 domain-containing protein [Flavobacteriaceae bacterium 3-367]
MKKTIITLLALALMPLAGFSQSLFDKYEDMEHVASVIINKRMMELITTIGEDADDHEARELAQLVSELDKIRVFITEDKGVSGQMKTSVDQYLNSSSMEELMRVKDEDTHVNFYIKNGKDDTHVKELLMFVSGMDKMKMGHNGREFETVLVSITGDIDLTKIGKLTDKMNLHRDLKKAGKKHE